MTRYDRAVNLGWVVEGKGLAAQVVVATLPDGVPLVLTGSALAIWNVCASETEDHRIIAQVAAEMGVPPELIAHDVRRFLEELTTIGLLSTPTSGKQPPQSAP
jgi:hypothetical protein